MRDTDRTRLFIYRKTDVDSFKLKSNAATFHLLSFTSLPFPRLPSFPSSLPRGFSISTTSFKTQQLVSKAAFLIEGTVVRFLIYFITTKSALYKLRFPTSGGFSQSLAELINTFQIRRRRLIYNLSSKNIKRSYTWQFEPHFLVISDPNFPLFTILEI